MCALLAVPKQLLEEVGPDTSDPFLLSDYMHGNVAGGTVPMLVPALPRFVCIPGTSSGLASLSQEGAIPWSVPIQRGWRWHPLGPGERKTQRVIPADCRALVQEGWSVVWGRTGRSRQPGHQKHLVSQPAPPCYCRWLVQRAQVLQAPGRPHDFY